MNNCKFIIFFQTRPTSTGFRTWWPAPFSKKTKMQDKFMIRDHSYPSPVYITTNYSLIAYPKKKKKEIIVEPIQAGYATTSTGLLCVNVSG